MSDTPVRKDVARNRALLLKTADDLFATQGMDVTLKDVARHAGVGVGTVYRHFPTKDALVDALYSDRAEASVIAAQAAADEPDGWTGLVRFLEESMEMQARNSGLRDAMSAATPSSPAIVECRVSIGPLLEQIVTKAQDQGSLRPDVSASDITNVQLALAALMDSTRGAPSEVYRTHLRLVLDGLRAERGGSGSAV